MNPDIAKMIANNKREIVQQISGEPGSLHINRMLGHQFAHPVTAHEECPTCGFEGLCEVDYKIINIDQARIMFRCPKCHETFWYEGEEE